MGVERARVALPSGPPRGPAIAPTDGELLVRFARRGDTAAFAELVECHAALVLSVCRQVLRRPADVDDAFQATFLILAKRASDIRASDSAAGWLYRVAYRTSVALARQNKSRPEEPLNGHDFAGADDDPLERIHQQHSVAVMIEELRALPSRYQEPLVLCYLEGHSRSRAAEMLDSTTATIKGRLARGKQLLRHRLARRGVALSIAAGIATSMVESAQAAASSATLATQTAHAASQFVTSGTAATSGGSAVASSLAQQGVSAMLYASLAKPLLAGITVLALGVGTVLATDAEPARTALPPAGVTLHASARGASEGDDETPPVAIEAPPLHREQVVVEEAAVKPKGQPAATEAPVSDAPPTIFTDPHSPKPRNPNYWSNTAPTAVDAKEEVPPTRNKTPRGGRTPPSAEAPTAGTPPNIFGARTSDPPRAQTYGNIIAPPTVDTTQQSPPAADTYVTIPNPVEGYAPVRIPLLSDYELPGLDEIQLERQYWQSLENGLIAKADAVQSKYKRVKASREKDPKSVTDEEWEDLNLLVGDSYIWRAESYQAKGKALEMQRKIAARVQQAQMPRPPVPASPTATNPPMTAPRYYTPQPATPVPYAVPYSPTTTPDRYNQPLAPQPATAQTPRPTDGPTFGESDLVERSVLERVDPGPADLLRPGDEVTIELQWKSGRHAQILRDCLSGSGTVRIPYAEGSITLAGPLAEAPEKLKDALRETNGETFGRLVKDVIVQPTGRRIVFVPSGGNASFTPVPTSPLQPQAQIIEPLLPPGTQAARSAEPGEQSVLISDADSGVNWITWHPDIDVAVRIAQQQRRKIVLHFVSHGNHEVALNELHLGSPAIRDYLVHNTVPAVISIDASPKVAERFKVTQVPTVCILNSDGTLLEKFTAPKNAKEYLTKLTAAGINPPTPAPPTVEPNRPKTPWPAANSYPSSWPSPPLPPIDPDEFVKLKQELEALREHNAELREKLEATEEEATPDPGPTNSSDVESPTHPPISSGDVVKLKQDFEALRDEYRRLQERVDAPHPNDSRPLGPPARLDPLPEHPPAE